MKLAASALFVLTGLLTVPAQSALGKLERTRLYGVDYIRLNDWAQAREYDVSWSRRNEEIRLTRAGSKVIFTVDSLKAEINGITVFFSWPVALRNNAAFLAWTDVERAMEPVLFPPKSNARAPIVRLALDPGHGGKDPGNEEGRIKEKDLTLVLARAVSRCLTDAGLDVILTRAEDRFVPLPDRTEIARRRDADLFVSLHFNSAIAEKDQVQGVEVYCLTPAGASSSNARSEHADTSACAGNRFDARNMLLAYQIQKAIIKNVPVEDRGVKRARFAVLRNARIPAVLIEAGFMSHPKELKHLFDPGYRRQLARAIADGILAYKQLVER